MLTLATVLFIISSLILPSVFAVPTIPFRGDSYEVIQLEPRTFQWQSEDKWVFNGTDFVPFIFRDAFLEEEFYEVQVGLIKARIYDDFATFYGNDFDDIRLHDERFELELKGPDSGDNFRPIGGQTGGAVFDISESADGINITKSFVSWAGELSIKYQFLEHLKHTIEFCSSQQTTETFKLLQVHRGIVADKLRHVNETTSVLRDITNATEIVATVFNYEKDGKTSLKEIQSASADVLETTNIKPHPKGFEAVYRFGEFQLKRGECFVVDPDTFTDDAPVEDSYIKTVDAVQATCPAPNTIVEANDILIHSVEEDTKNGGCTRGMFEWNITAITDGSTVTNVTFTAEIKEAVNERVCEFRDAAAQPSTLSASDAWDDAEDGTIFLSDSTVCDNAGTNKVWIFNAAARTDVESRLVDNWWGFFTKAGDESRDSLVHKVGVFSEQQSPAPTPKPTLTVTFTVPITTFNETLSFTAEHAQELFVIFTDVEPIAESLLIAGIAVAFILVVVGIAASRKR